LKQRTFCFRFARGYVKREAELLQKLLCEEFWDRGDVRAGALVPLERGLIRAIEDKERVDGEGEETQEAVIEGSESRVRPAFAGLDLEEPDRGVDGNAEWTSCFFEFLNRKLRQGNAFAWANLFVNSTWILDRIDWRSVFPAYP
jgi:hypothetical protein